MTGRHPGLVAGLRGRFRGVVLVLALLVSSWVVTASPAAAKDNVPGSPTSSCAGSLIKSYPYKTKYGSVKVSVYYSSAKNGTNCIIAKKSGAWKGKKTFMNLSIERSDAQHLGYYPYVAYDSGSYKSYAGAISIPNTNGKCINWTLDVGSSRSAKSQFKHYGKNGKFCG